MTTKKTTPEQDRDVLNFVLGSIANTALAQRHAGKSALESAMVCLEDARNGGMALSTTSVVLRRLCWEVEHGELGDYAGSLDPAALNLAKELGAITSVSIRGEGSLHDRLTQIEKQQIQALQTLVDEIGRVSPQENVAPRKPKMK